MTTAHPGEAHPTSVNAKLNTLRAGVLGANDGIVSTSALLLGVIASGAGSTAIFTAGMAAAVAGAVSMALGEYVSVSAQRDSEKSLIAKETGELTDMPAEETEEMAGILRGYGISAETAEKAAAEIQAGDPLRAHLQLELGIDEEDLTSPWAAAGSSALLPMLAVLIAPHSVAAVVVTVVTLLALAVTGAVSARLGGNPVGKSVARLVIGGALGLAVTYAVGSLFDV